MSNFGQIALIFKILSFLTGSLILGLIFYNVGPFNPEFMHYLWLISIVVWISKSATMLSEKGPFDKDIWDCIFYKKSWAASFSLLFSFVPSWQGLLYILGQAWKSRPFLLSTHEIILSTFERIFFPDNKFKEGLRFFDLPLFIEVSPKSNFLFWSENQYFHSI